MGKQTFKRRKNTVATLAVFFVIISLTATAVSAADAIQHTHKGGSHPSSHHRGGHNFHNWHDHHHHKLHDHYYNDVYYANYEWIYNPVTRVWDWTHASVVEKAKPPVDEVKPSVEEVKPSVKGVQSVSYVPTPVATIPVSYGPTPIVTIPVSPITEKMGYTLEKLGNATGKIGETTEKMDEKTQKMGYLTEKFGNKLSDVHMGEDISREIGSKNENMENAPVKMMNMTK